MRRGIAAGRDGIALVQRFGVPLFLLGLCVLAYGLWVPRMGWYWDDFPIGWIARTFGPDGLERYFSTNRPVWGLVYRLTTAALGTHPLAWQIFAIFWRWVTGLALWWLLRLVWPRRTDFAAWAAALFVVYPGFSQQFISLVYSHFFIVLAAFLGSLALSIYALRRPRLFWPLTGLAWALGLFNLLCMEYFFFLELARPLLLWCALGDLPAPARRESPGAEGSGLDALRGEYAALPSGGRRVGRALALWLPYAASLLGVIVWRTFFFSSGLYEPVFTGMLRSDPLGALAYLGERVAGDAFLAVVQVWQNALHMPTAEELTPNLMLVFWGTVAGGALLALAFAVLIRPADEAQKGKSGWFWGPLLVGLALLLVSGAPFWLTALPLRLTFHFDRFNLAYMFAAALVTVGLVYLAPIPRWVRIIPLALGLGLCVGYQFQQAVVYIRDWNVQQRMFWQLSWRMPGLRPGTMLFSNELPVKHYSDNSLTAAMNWVFDPENRTQRMAYALLYPTVRVGANNLLPSLAPDLPVDLDYLAARFVGNTSQAVAFYYNPPGCVRILDPEVERDNFTLPQYLRRAMSLSGTGPILPEGSPEIPAGSPALPAALFGVQSQDSWCYYFEKADLARQQKDWAQVVALSEQGLATGDYPNDPTERLPAIEGYAHLGDWKNALEQSRLAAGVAPVYEMVVCRLWEHIRREVPPGPGLTEAANTIWADYRCDEPRQEPKPDPKSEGVP